MNNRNRQPMTPLRAKILEELEQELPREVPWETAISHSSKDAKNPRNPSPRKRRWFHFLIRPEFWILLALAILAIIIIIPNLNRARAQAKKKACVSNMKTIEGACELYLMEKAVPQNTSIDPERLHRVGHLKEIPHCPSGGQYTITVGSTAGGGGGSGATVIKCSTHQGVADISCLL